MTDLGKLTKEELIARIKELQGDPGPRWEDKLAAYLHIWICTGSHDPDGSCDFYRGRKAKEEWLGVAHKVIKENNLSSGNYKAFIKEMGTMYSLMKTARNEWPKAQKILASMVDAIW